MSYTTQPGKQTFGHLNMHHTRRPPNPRPTRPIHGACCSQRFFGEVLLCLGAEPQRAVDAFNSTTGATPLGVEFDGFASVWSVWCGRNGATSVCGRPSRKG